MVGLHLLQIIICYLCTIKHLDSIIVYENNFNAKKDADALNKAVTFFVCDKDVIIDIIAHRYHWQRYRIEIEFRNTYKKVREK